MQGLEESGSRNALRSLTRGIVSSYCCDAEHEDAVLQALARPGYALDPNGPFRAGRFSLAVSRAAAGEVNDAAVHAAVAVELQTEASFMFDDVGDDEVDPSLGTSNGEVLALAIAVACCANAAAMEAVARARVPGTPLRTFLDFQKHCITACGGQYLDAALQRGTLASTARSLRMTTMKAGGLGRAAGSLGAGTATDTAWAIRRFGDLGFNWFSHAQLVDDLRDACSPAGGDYSRGKQTATLVFFQDRLAEQGLPRSSGMIGEIDVGRAFNESGARLYGAILAETYLHRVRETLVSLQEEGYPVGQLEELAESLDSSFERTLEAP